MKRKNLEMGVCSWGRSPATIELVSAKGRGLYTPGRKGLT